MEIRVIREYDVHAHHLMNLKLKPDTLCSKQNKKSTDEKRSKCRVHTKCWAHCEMLDKISRLFGSADTIIFFEYCQLSPQWRRVLSRCKISPFWNEIWNKQSVLCIFVSKNYQFQSVIHSIAKTLTPKSINHERWDPTDLWVVFKNWPLLANLTLKGKFGQFPSFTTCN